MSKQISELTKALTDLLDKDQRELLGTVLTVFGIMAVFVGFPLLMMWGINFVDSEENPTEKCWAIQELKGDVYKVNECTGQVEMLAAKEKKSDLKQPESNSQ